MEKDNLDVKYKIMCDGEAAVNDERSYVCIKGEFSKRLKNELVYRLLQEHGCPGAAFDFHAGIKPRTSAWMKKYSLEWFHRLCSEPGRLWKRHHITNTKSRILSFVRYNIW